MAEERVDPLGPAGLHTLDHVARYFWAGKLLGGRRILDAACGTGFGTHMLAAGKGTRVTGVDRDAASITSARQRFAHPNVTFLQLDLQHGPDIPSPGFDAIVSFETLEHLADPAAVVQKFSTWLKADGLFLASVPGEGDADRDNPYHLHHFSRSDFRQLIAGEFKHALYFQQSFSLATAIIADPDGGDAQPPQAHLSPQLTADPSALHALSSPQSAAAPTAIPDTRLVVASHSPLPAMPDAMLVHARDIWQVVQGYIEHQAEYTTALERRADELGRHFKDLEHKFNEVLAWGRHYHARATAKSDATRTIGEKPD